MSNKPPVQDIHVDIAIHDYIVDDPDISILYSILSEWKKYIEKKSKKNKVSICVSGHN